MDGRKEGTTGESFIPRRCHLGAGVTKTTSHSKNAATAFLFRPRHPGTDRLSYWLFRASPYADKEGTTQRKMQILEHHAFPGFLRACLPRAEDDPGAMLGHTIESMRTASASPARKKVICHHIKHLLSRRREGRSEAWPHSHQARH
jgi:hypothetical protein